MLLIRAAVGRGGNNNSDDVRLVQQLLNEFRPPQEQLAVTGDLVDVLDDPTIKAILEFQEEFVRLPKPDGRVDVSGKTIFALAKGMTKADKLSGAAWFNASAARFPGSRKIKDLVEPFKKNVDNFHKALLAAGASVTINSTFRHRLRALLMHYSWRIVNGDISPEDADSETRFHEPDLNVLNIKWDHGNDIQSRIAAQEMLDKFGIKKTLRVAPSLNTRHRFGKAIDMNVKWDSKTLGIKKLDGTIVEITATEEDLLSHKNEMNKELHEVAFSYGVVKFGYRVTKGKLTGKASTGDRPHWSDTGG